MDAVCFEPHALDVPGGLAGRFGQRGESGQVCEHEGVHRGVYLASGGAVSISERTSLSLLMRSGSRSILSTNWTFSGGGSAPAELSSREIVSIRCRSSASRVAC